MSHPTILTMKEKKRTLQHMIITYQFIYHFHLFNSLIWVEFSEHSYIGSLTCISTNLLIILLVFYYFCLNSFLKFLLKYFLKNCFCKGISVVTRQFWFHLKMSFILLSCKRQYRKHLFVNIKSLLKSLVHYSLVK